MPDKKISQLNQLPLVDISSDGTKERFYIAQKVGLLWTSFSLTLANLLSWLQSKIRPYKVFRGTLTSTQSTQTSGTLTVGQAYTITSYLGGGDDFSNIATVLSGTINSQMCTFVATGTTPASWTGGSVLTKVVMAENAMENDLGSVTYQQDSTGLLGGKIWVNIKSAGLFTAGKTWIRPLSTLMTSTSAYAQGVFFIWVDSSTIRMVRVTNAVGSANDMGTTSAFPFEILVYP